MNDFNLRAYLKHNPLLKEDFPFDSEFSGGEVLLDFIMQNADEVANEIGLKGNQESEYVDMVKRVSKLTVEKEAELAEINPLAILKDGTLIALDGKIRTDDNSNFRHEELLKYQETIISKVK